MYHSKQVFVEKLNNKFISVKICVGRRNRFPGARVYNGRSLFRSCRKEIAAALRHACFPWPGQDLISTTRDYGTYEIRKNARNLERENLEHQILNV